MKVAIISLIIIISAYGTYKVSEIIQFTADNEIVKMKEQEKSLPQSHDTLFPNQPHPDIIPLQRKSDIVYNTSQRIENIINKSSNSLQVQKVLDRIINTERTVVEEGELLSLMSNSDIEAISFTAAIGLKSIANQWHCDVSSEISCSEEGCNQIESPVWFELDFKQNYYRHCDDDQCDESRMILTSSKRYTTITLPSRAISLRIANSDTTFTGAFSQGDEVITLFGKCIPTFNPSKQLPKPFAPVATLDY